MYNYPSGVTEFSLYMLCILDSTVPLKEAVQKNF